MADTTYRIFQREDGSYAVDIVRVGALRQTAAGFDTEAQAKAWIAQDQRLWVTTEASPGLSTRRWRSS